jgi:hypothetical protein
MIAALWTSASLLVVGAPALGTSSDLFVPPPDSAPGDGVYGRLDGDLGLAIGALAEADFTRRVVRPGAVGTLRFYQTVGVYIGLSQSVEATDPLERRLVAGFVLEPLFILRWPEYRHSGRAFWDLTLDSIGLHGGVAIHEPRGGNFGSAVLANVGVGLGVPLTNRAEGLWLRTRLDVELGNPAPAFIGWVGLEWQFMFESQWMRHSTD